MSEQVPNTPNTAASKLHGAGKSTAGNLAQKSAAAGVKKAAGKAVAKTKVKPTMGTAVANVTQKATDRLADRATKSADLTTEQGARKVENAQIASDVTSGALSGAATGARAGAVGAGVGAALGAGKALMGSGAGRKRLKAPLIALAAIAVLSLFAPLLVASTVITAVTGTLSSLGQSDAEASVGSVQATVDSEGGNPQAGAELAGWAINQSQSYPAVPWQVIAAVEHELPGEAEQDTIDLAAVNESIEKLDPNAAHRNLADGALRSGDDNTQHLYIPDPQEGGSDQTWDEHEKTKEIMTASLKAGGATSAQADSIWETSLSWALGIIQGCPTPSSSDTADTSAGAANDTAGVTSASLSPAQLANARTIIGVAKGMFGDDWEAASVIGLLTSMQESKLQIAANDGVVRNEYMADGSILANETGRTSEWPLDAYPVVAKSQKFTHQFTGSMYLTLGLFQQMANQHWSTLGSATWATDPDAAVARLMDPEFSAFAFFRGLKDKAPHWQDMDPIAAAEAVQVSGMGENTRKWKNLAEEIVDQHGAGAPSITPPEGDEATDGEVSTVSGGAGDCEISGVAAPVTGAQGEVAANGWAWPTDMRAVMQGPHLGMSVDLGASSAGPLFAPYAGVVVRAGGDGMAFGPYCPTSAWWRGENKTVMIKSVYQGKTLYSSHNHVGSVQVQVGQTVKAGQQVAAEGMSGCTSAPHNHFFIASGPLYNGDIDPFQYIGRP